VPRRTLVIRRLIVFQIKLVLDGLKDIVLSPLSLLVAAIGLISPVRSESAWKWLFSLGRKFDDWVNIFPELDSNEPSRGVDRLAKESEALFKRLRQGKTSREEIRAELRKLLDQV
jgi:hypothetical protein